MGECYRKQVISLIESLNEPDRRTEAAELIRALVDNIVFRRRTGARNGLPLISLAIWLAFSAWFQKLAENRQ